MWFFLLYAVLIENPREFTVVFNASNDNETETVWVDIPITDDNIVVGNRRFLVQLIIPQKVKDDPSVILGSAQSAELILLEDDGEYVYLCTYLHMYVHTYVCLYRCVPMYVHTYVCLYRCVRMYIYM